MNHNSETPLDEYEKLEELSPSAVREEKQDAPVLPAPPVPPTQHNRDAELFESDNGVEKCGKPSKHFWDYHESFSLRHSRSSDLVPI